MSRIIRGQLVALSALLAALVVTLAACGGGSSSTGGGGNGSGGTIAGTVDNGLAAVHPSGADQPLLFAIADTLIKPAYADGMAGVTVTVVETGDVFVTGNDGGFVFSGLAPGTYTLDLLGTQITVHVVAGQTTKVTIGSDGTLISTEMIAGPDPNDPNGVICGTIDEGTSSDDDDSSCDGASFDGDSASDDASSDGESLDGDSDGESADGDSDGESVDGDSDSEGDV